MSGQFSFIKECRKCGQRVIATADNRCPHCRSDLATGAAAVAPPNLPAFTDEKENLFSFRGRIGRRTFLMRVGCFFLASFLINLVVVLFGGDPSNPSALAFLFLLPPGVVASWFSLATHAKRLHDLNKSSWLLLTYLTIVAIPIVFVYMAAVRGSEGPNRYGADPLAAGASRAAQTAQG